MSGWTSGMRLPAAFDNNSPTGISTCGLLRLSSTVSPIIFPTSSITSGVREIEAFVDQGKVRNDVAGHSQRQRGPILKRRRLDVAARDFAVADSHPVKQLSARRFDGRQSLGVPRRWHRHEHRSRRKILQRFQDEARGNGGLVDADARARQHISILVLWDIDVKVAIAAAPAIATAV